MSHFAYIRPSGVFNGGIPVDHSELTSFDQRIFKALNADDGGTWAPSSPIVIGGSGVQILITGSSSSLASGATFTSNGDLILASGSTTEHNGADTYNGTGNFTGFSVSNYFGGSSTTFSPGALLQFEGTHHSNDGIYLLGPGTSWTANGPFYFGGAGTFAGGDVVFSGTRVVFNTDIAVGGTTDLNGPLNINAHTTLNEDLLITGIGGIAWRAVVGASTNTTYSVGSVDEVVAPSSINSLIIYSIDNVGAVQGKRMRFSFYGATGTGAIGIQASSTTLFLLGSAGRGGFYCEWCEIVFLSGSWRQSASGRAVPAI